MIISPKIELRPAQGMGKGFFAKQDIEAGQELLSINNENFISSETFDGFFEFSELNCTNKVSGKTLLAYFLATVHMTPNNYIQQHKNIREYINQLPKEMNGLVCWSTQELDKISNKQLIQKVLKKQRRIEQEFKMIKLSMKQVWKIPIQNWQYRLFTSKQQIQLVSLNKFFYFYSAIESRSVHYACSQDVGALVPYLELFNHSSAPQCQVQIDLNYVVRTIIKINKDQQIFVNYGNYSNENFLQLYGFLPGLQQVLPANQNYRMNLAEKMKRERESQIIAKEEQENF